MTTVAEEIESGVEVNGTNGDPRDTLSVISRAEIDMQISTAKRYPRSFALAKKRMIDMATADEETAAGCFYTLKRRARDGSNFIAGPSIRLAEIALSAWGNVRSGARIVGEDDRFVTAQGVCHDLETNTSTTIEVRRRITNKEGVKYNDDMIGVTANAACAIALRNAVYKVVPKVFINAAYQEALKAAKGDVRTLGERRQNAISEFAKMFVDLSQLTAFLDKPGAGIDDITSDDLLKLRGVLTAIRDGETTVDEAFPQPASQTSQLNERVQALKEKKNGTSRQPAPAAESESASAPEAGEGQPAPVDTEPVVMHKPDPKAAYAAFEKMAEQKAHSSKIEPDDFDRAYKRRIVAMGLKGKEHTMLSGQMDAILEDIDKRQHEFAPAKK